MNATELERLLWEQLDGTITAGDTTRLDAYLAAHPEAESTRQQVAATARLLGAVDAVQPPPTLPDDIVRLLAMRPAARLRHHFWRELAHEVLAPRWRARLAWATVGICLGVALAALFIADFGRSGEGDVSRFYGTMRGQPGGPPARGLVMELPGAQGRVVLHRRGASLIVALRAARQPDGPLTLELEGQGMGILMYRTEGHAASTVTVHADHVSVEATGSGELLLDLDAAPARLLLRLRSGKAVVFERDFGLDQVPSG